MTAVKVWACRWRKCACWKKPYDQMVHAGALLTEAERGQVKVINSVTVDADHRIQPEVCAARPTASR